MNLAGERKAYDAAGALADELPYWGWLAGKPFCLTRRGELVCIGALEPAIMDGKTPAQLDQVLQRWQRMLSQLPADETRFYFYFLRRPLTYEPAVAQPGDVGELAQARRREFLASRLQRIETYVAWCHDPGLRRATRHAPGLLNAALAGPKSWLAKWRRPDEAAYYAEAIERAAGRFRQLVEASASLVDDITPIRILDAADGNAFLSELVNRPGTPSGGSPAGSAVNWRLALSELEAERRFLRLDGEPVVLYSMLSPPVRGRANMLHELFCLGIDHLTVSMEWRPKATASARRAIRTVQRAHFSKRYSAAAHMQETDGSSSAMMDATADEEAARVGLALVELEADGIAYGDISLTLALHGDLKEIEGRDAEIRRIFAGQDAKLIREAYGQIPAWFSRLPGQPRKRQLRKVLGSAGLMGSLAPLFGPASLPATSPHLGKPALALFETPWRTALPYDLYAGDVGHTLILGATGAGKSFLLNFLLVQALQYDPRILVLDLGGSYRWLTKFLGGGYIELSPDNPDATLSLQPFSLPKSDRTIRFLTAWIIRLLKIGGYALGGADTSEIPEPGRGPLCVPAPSPEPLPLRPLPPPSHVAGHVPVARGTARGAGSSTTPQGTTNSTCRTGRSSTWPARPSTRISVRRRSFTSWNVSGSLSTIRTKSGASSSWSWTRRGATCKTPPFSPISPRPRRPGGRGMRPSSWRHSPPSMSPGRPARPRSSNPCRPSSFSPTPIYRPTWPSSSGSTTPKCRASGGCNRSASSTSVDRTSRPSPASRSIRRATGSTPLTPTTRPDDRPPSKSTASRAR